ncbi:MAG TPA: hypothetical protein VIM53_01450 [Candidatus Saccharimonadales bacterium]
MTSTVVGIPSLDTAGFAYLESAELTMKRVPMIDGAIQKDTV